MPYPRKRFSRRRPMRRKRTYRRKPMTAGRVKRIVAAELKTRDLGVGPSAIPTVTGNVVLISGISQGDNATERNGNWIKPVSFHGTLNVQGNTVSMATHAEIRVGCLIWNENQEMDPCSLDKFMEDTSSPYQGYKVAAKGQFKILWSRNCIVSNNSSNSQHFKQLSFYVKPSRKILYEAANNRKFHVFMFAYSNIAGESNPPTWSFDVRLRYTDS